MNSGPLVLAGPPAAGKTTVGRLVGERLGADFADTDEVLADRLGLTLPEAYASLPAALIADSHTLVAVHCLRRPGVVSLGSAAVESAQVRAALTDLTVIWLSVSAAQATRRLRMSAFGMDTLLQVRDRMDAMLRARQHWYEQVATVRIETDRLTAEQTADRVVQTWKGES